MSYIVDLFFSDKGRVSRSGYAWAVAGLIFYSEIINPAVASLANVKVRAHEAVVSQTLGKDQYVEALTNGEQGLPPGFAEDAAKVAFVDAGMNTALGLFFVAMVIVLMRTFYVLVKKRVRDIGWPIIASGVPVGLFLLRQIAGPSLGEIGYIVMSLFFMGSFIGLALIPGEKEDNAFGPPPPQFWPEPNPSASTKRRQTAYSPVRRRRFGETPGP